MNQDAPLISEFSHERSRPREAEALLTLRKIASVVKPIMRQRNWRVGVLKEFYPEERNLLGLNVNKGQSICLRLRYPSDQSQFLPFEDVVDTMLHELSHIVHGPHDNFFHQLWDKLREEHEALLRKGYTGEGFLGRGKALGGQRIPMQEARRRARAAAEKRRSLAAGSGQRLGGAPVARNMDIRNVILDAIERRKNITKGCVSDSTQKDMIIEETNRNGFRTKAEEDDANERAIAQAYMELVQEEQKEKYGKDYVEPTEEHPEGSQEQKGAASSQKSRIPPPPMPKHTKPQPSSGLTLEPEKKLTSPNDSWTCEICTLNNPANFLCCDACGTERSSVPPSDYTALEDASHSSQPLGPRSGASGSKHPKSSIAEENKLRSRRSKQNLQKYAAWGEVESKKPLGWLCQKCGTFMENEWWSCASCGTVKSTS